MLKKSYLTLKKRWKNYPHLNELEIFLDRIQEADPEFLMLFGSLATGNFTQHSDIDILCVFSQDFQNARERFLHAYRYSNGIVQPKSLSINEFKGALLNGDSFIVRIVEEGLILYSKIPESDIEFWIKSGKNQNRVAYFSPGQ